MQYLTAVVLRAVRYCVAYRQRHALPCSSPVYCITMKVGGSHEEVAHSSENNEAYRFILHSSVLHRPVTHHLVPFRIPFRPVPYTVPFLTWVKDFGLRRVSNMSFLVPLSPLAFSCSYMQHVKIKTKTTANSLEIK